MTQSVAKNTMYLTIATVSQRIIAFVYFLFVARIMKPENTGAYFLALSIIMIFMVISNFGIAQVVIREIAKNTESARSWLKHGLGLKIPLIILSIICANLAAYLLSYSSEVRVLVLLSSLTLTADALSVLFYGVLRGFQKLQYESVGIFIGQLVTVGIGLSVLLIKPTLPLLIVALICGSFFNLFFSAFQVSRVLGYQAFIPVISRQMSGQFLKITVPFGLAGVFSKISSYADTILLSLFISTTAVGIYAVAYKLTYAFQFLPMAFIAALYPGLSSLAKTNPSRLPKLFDQAMWYMMILATPIALGIWSLAPDVVRLAGSEYDSAIPVLRLLILVLFPIFLDFPIGSLLNAVDKQAVKTAILGFATLVNVVMNAVLIPTHGLGGAVYAALVSFSLMFLAGLLYIPRVVPGYRILDLIKMILPILLSGLCMSAAVVYARPIVGFILAVPTGALVYISMLIITRSVRRQHVQSVFRLLKKTDSYENPTPAHDA
ncbi:flippase [Patescibacteria group bacterium]|nr:flippase [Patescibacteria group bacterium]MBU1705399.1 flippase [Patescibacteria group bacterium]